MKKPNKAILGLLSAALLGSTAVVAAATPASAADESHPVSLCNNSFGPNHEPGYTLQLGGTNLYVAPGAYCLNNIRSVKGQRFDLVAHGTAGQVCVRTFYDYYGTLTALTGSGRFIDGNVRLTARATTYEQVAADC
ncbi:MAG: hypothetical protein ACRYF3_01155 [Janthinobacterium lividum]